MTNWFQKNIGIILNSMVLIFALIMGYLPLRYDIIEREVNGTIKAITKYGKLFIIIGILALIAGIGKIFQDQAESAANSAALSNLTGQNSSISAQLTQEVQSVHDLKNDNIVLKYDLGVLIAKSDSNFSRNNIPPQTGEKVVNYPLLDICAVGDGMNPTLIPTSNPDSMALQYLICNYGSSEAQNLRERIFFIGEKEGKLFLFDKIHPPSSNKSLIIPKFPGSREYWTPIYPNRVLPGNIYYSCFFLDYDANNHNKKRMRKVFTATPFKPNTRLYEVDSAKYESITTFLKA